MSVVLAGLALALVIVATLPSRLGLHERLALLFILQVTTFNPVVTQIEDLAVYLNTLAVIPVLLVGLLRLRESGAWPVRPMAWSSVVLVVVLAVDAVVVGTGPNASSNLSRLALLPISALALLPAWRVWPAMVGTMALGLTIRCLLLLVDAGGASINISHRLFVGELGGPNAFGLVLALSAILIFQASSEGSWLAWLRLALPPLLVVMYLTFSRGAFVSLAAGTAALILVSRTPLFQKLAMVCGVVVITGWVVEAFPYVGTRLTDLSVSGSSGRDLIFRRALDGFLDHPLLGNGFGSFTNVTLAGETSAHNVYLQVLFEAGLLGFGGVAVAAWILLRRLVSRQAVPLLVAIAVGSATDNHFLVVQISWFFPLAIIYWMRCIQDEPSSARGEVSHDHSNAVHEDRGPDHYLRQRANNRSMPALR